MPDPETRASLLLRIRDPQDRDAWEQFAVIYRPVIIRLARHRGIQSADAEDLAQQVLFAVSQAIERFEPDGKHAKFRTWLRVIARNAIVNVLTRRTPDQAVGGSDALGLLHEQPAAGAVTETLCEEYRREIFQVAAEMIRDEFQPDTWTAFWDSVVSGKSVDDVARSLGRSRGSIYTSRSRVMARLKQMVSELDVRANDPSEVTQCR